MKALQRYATEATARRELVLRYNQIVSKLLKADKRVWAALQALDAAIDTPTSFADAEIAAGLAVTVEAEKLDVPPPVTPAALQALMDAAAAE
jgi:3-oxoacyl-(acyl-carrier-protein) synthase